MWIGWAIDLVIDGLWFKPWWEQINLFIVANNTYGLNVKGWESPRGNGQPREFGKIVHNGLWKVIIDIKKSIFVLFLFTTIKSHIKREG